MVTPIYTETMAAFIVFISVEIIYYKASVNIYSVLNDISLHSFTNRNVFCETEINQPVLRVQNVPLSVYKLP